MDFFDIFSQGVGILATFATVFSFQFKTQKGIMTMQSVGTVLWTLHFLLIGALSGSLLNLMCAARAIIYAKRSSKEWAKSVSWVYIFTVTALVIYALQFIAFGKEPTIKNLIVEFLPTLGVISTNVGYRLESGFKVRCSQFISSPAWMIYNVFSHSIGGVITEIFSLVSTIVGIIRHDIKRAKE